MEISTIMPGPIVHTGRKIPEYISSPILKPGIKVHGGRCNPVTKHLAAEAALLAPVGVVMCCIHFLYHGRSIPVSCCARGDLTSFSLEHSTIETTPRLKQAVNSGMGSPVFVMTPFFGSARPVIREECCLLTGILRIAVCRTEDTADSIVVHTFHQLRIFIFPANV